MIKCELYRYARLLISMSVDYMENKMTDKTFISNLKLMVKQMEEK